MDIFRHLKFSNQVIPVGEFESGMNFYYVFNNGNNNVVAEGCISASLTNLPNYHLKIHSTDMNIRDNASFRYDSAFDTLISEGTPPAHVRVFEK